MYALKLPHMFSGSNTLPVIKITQNLKGIACSGSTSDVAPQWKYHGSIAPRMRESNHQDALKQLLEKAANISAYGTQQTMLNLVTPNVTVTASHTLSQMGTDHEA
jgi:hypothetical protein